MMDEFDINGTDSRVLRQLMSGRHSCRAFLPDPVSVELQRWILECALRSASWCNAQPWQVHITQGQATDRFRELMLSAADTTESDPDFAFPAAYGGVHRQARFAWAMQPCDCVKAVRGDRLSSARQARENFRLFGAPHVALITSDARLGVYGALDCGAFVSNFLLAAASVGVATIPQAALATRPWLVREFFGLDSNRLVVCGISFGYEDHDHPANQFRTQRADVKDIASFVWQ